MDDRIKLAEAIGWKQGSLSSMYEAITNDPIFDPFTDANDDYAVLEGMREKQKNANPIMGDSEWIVCCRFFAAIQFGAVYQIGDYARAALKVIGETK